MLRSQPDFCSPKLVYFTVPNSVPKLTIEVTLRDVWCLSATVSDWDCVASYQGRELLNRYTG
jgi:hypothetical protein